MAGCFISSAVLVHQRVAVVSVVFFVMENHWFLAGRGIDAALWVFLEVPLVLGHVDVDIVPSYLLKTEEDKKKEMLHHHRSFLSETLFQREVRDNVGQTEILWLTTTLLQHWESNWTETRSLVLIPRQLLSHLSSFIKTYSSNISTAVSRNIFLDIASSHIRLHLKADFV